MTLFVDLAQTHMLTMRSKRNPETSEAELIFSYFNDAAQGLKDVCIIPLQDVV